jgi:transcriptional regulator with XRE-family HTH domain
MDASVHPVRAFRLSQKPPLKQEVLAKRIGMSKPHLSRIETGKQRISDHQLPRFVAETGIPARVLRPDLAKLFSPPARSRDRRRARATA